MGHLTSLGGWGHYVNVDLHPLQGWESYRGELGTGTARWQEVGKSFGRRLPETGNWKPETGRQNGGRGKESGSGGAGGGWGGPGRSALRGARAPLSECAGEPLEAFCRTLRASEEDTPGQEALAETR